MNWKNINRQAITFCAVSLLFLGSLYYFVSIAIENKDTLMGRQTARDYLENWEE